MKINEFIKIYFNGCYRLVGGISEINVAKGRGNWLMVDITYKFSSTLSEEIKDEIGLSIVELLDRYAQFPKGKETLILLDILFDNENLLMVLKFSALIPFGLRILDVINAILVERFKELFEYSKNFKRQACG